VEEETLVAHPKISWGAMRGEGCVYAWGRGEDEDAGIIRKGECEKEGRYVDTYASDIVTAEHAPTCIHTDKKKHTHT
jgi:hypothetical protein